MDEFEFKVEIGDGWARIKGSSGHNGLNSMLNQIWNYGDHDMRLRVTQFVEQVFYDYLLMKEEEEKAVEKPNRKIIPFPINN